MCIICTEWGLSLFVPGVHWAVCKMSMVLFASVVRVRDGLPLSASTDYEQDKGFQETQKHLKGLSKKLSQFPDRSSLRSGLYNIKWVVIAMVMRMCVKTECLFYFTLLHSSVLNKLCLQCITLEMHLYLKGFFLIWQWNCCMHVPCKKNIYVYIFERITELINQIIHFAFKPCLLQPPLMNLF